MSETTTSKTPLTNKLVKQFTVEDDAMISPKDCRAIEERLNKCVEALEFYSDHRKYEGPNSVADPDEECVAGYYRLDVTRDHGNKAQAAIAEARKPL